MTSNAHDPSLPPWLHDAPHDDQPKRRDGKVVRLPFQEAATEPALPARPTPAVDEPARSPIDDLDLLRRAKRPPRSGWRRAVHNATRGRINPGESRADLAYRALVDRVNQPIRGDYRIAVLSLKGGVGKTTTTVGLGATFASVRGDRVIAVDANPDLGTLVHRAPRQTRSTVRTLLDDPDIRRYSDVRVHTSQAPSRLDPSSPTSRRGRRRGDRAHADRLSGADLHVARGAHARQRCRRPRPAGNLEPPRQRGQVEPTCRARRDRGCGCAGDRHRPWPRNTPQDRPHVFDRFSQGRSGAIAPGLGSRPRRRHRWGSRSRTTRRTRGQRRPGGASSSE